MNTETQARQTFAQADRTLQSAIAEYSRARKALYAITGEFAGVDDKSLQQFSTRAAAASDAASGQPQLTDC